MKKNTKRLTSILLAMTLVAGASFSCIFASAENSTIITPDDSGNMSIPTGSEPQVLFTSTVTDGNTYSATIEYGKLEFKYEFSHKGGEWSGKWSADSFNGINNKITITNNSTGAIGGTISYDSLTSNDVDNLDLGINIGTNMQGTEGQTSADVRLAAGASAEYFLHSKADLASQVNNNNIKKDALEYNQGNAGIVKVELYADTSAL